MKHSDDHVPYVTLNLIVVTTFEVLSDSSTLLLFHPAVW